MPRAVRIRVGFNATLNIAGHFLLPGIAAPFSQGNLADTLGTKDKGPECDNQPRRPGGGATAGADDGF